MEGEDKKRYKCRNNVFASTANFLKFLIEDGIIIKPEEIKECDDFINFLTTRNDEGRNREFFVKSDIDRINRVLKIGLDACMAKYILQDPELEEEQEK